MDPELLEHDRALVDEANATGRRPVVFVHGLWLLPASWDRWLEVFRAAGYAPLAPGWPDDPGSVAEANADPAVFADKSIGAVVEHYTALIGKLDQTPAVIGHSFGGLFAQILAGNGLSAATVAIDPAPFRGVLPLPISALRAGSPILGHPTTRHKAVPLTYEQFRYAFANAVDEDEARELYERFAVPAPGLPLWQAATANINPRTEAAVAVDNPDRGPLLIISGERDHTVPWALASAAHKQYENNPAPTEIVEIPDRGHALTIDHGWEEVARTALTFIQRFV
jgi:non-heme chloroperoxidase